jgi:hypothetical protein
MGRIWFLIKIKYMVQLSIILNCIIDGGVYPILNGINLQLNQDGLLALIPCNPKLKKSCKLNNEMNDE